MYRTHVGAPRVSTKMVIAASRNVVATMGFGPNRSAIGDSAITPTTAPPFKSSRKVNALLAAKPLSSKSSAARCSAHR